MSIEEDVKKLCDLSKLEIPDEMIMEATKKVGDVLALFSKLDEFKKSDYDIRIENDLRVEKSYSSLRADQSPDINTDNNGDRFEFQPLNIKNGFIVGPRI